MTLIRDSLLSDETDSDSLKRGLLVFALCLLISILIHIIFFSVWQIARGESADNFHFVLVEKNERPIELALTFGEFTSGGGGDSLSDPQLFSETGTPGANQGLFSPPDQGAKNGESDDFWGELGRSALENAGLPQGLTPDIQSDIPPSMVDKSLAKAELIQLGGEETVNVNPDPPMSVESQAPPYKSYDTLIKRLINSRWIMPPEAREQFRPGRLTALFTIRKDGQLLRLVVQESSGNATLDHAGLEALRAAAPFPPFPPEFSSEEQVDIIMHFDYKADYKQSSRGR